MQNEQKPYGYYVIPDEIDQILAKIRESAEAILDEVLPIQLLLDAARADTKATEPVSYWMRDSETTTE